jgi:hypothetical protein
MVAAQPVSEVWWIKRPGTPAMNFERTKEATERQERERDYKLVAICKRAPLDQTEPRLEAELRETDHVVAAKARPTERIHRDPEVRREGNDVTQAAFQSPYAHLAALYYERMIFARHELSSLFHREEDGAGRRPVQMATLGRDNFAELTRRQMFEAGMFLQQDMTMVPTGSEYAGVGGQKDFDPNADGLMVHADCYLVINGKEGHSIHASYTSGTLNARYSTEPLSADSET